MVAVQRPWKDEIESMDISVAVPNALAIIQRPLRCQEHRPGRRLHPLGLAHVGVPPINAYCVSLNIATYVHFGEKMGELAGWITTCSPKTSKKPPRSWSKPGVMQAFQHYFGEYPFIRDSYELVHVPYTGMEHQSAVASGNGFRNGFVGARVKALKFNFASSSTKAATNRSATP